MGLYADHESYMQDMSGKPDTLWFEKKITIYSNGKLILWMAKHDGEGTVLEVCKEIVGGGADAIKHKFEKKVAFPNAKINAD